MSQDKDYSLLRPLDLEAVKVGDEIINEYGDQRIYVDGPDYMGAVCVKGSNGGLYINHVGILRAAPLCWVEGKPVYKGDVLWASAINGDWHEFKVEGSFDQNGETVIYPEDGRDGWIPVSRLRITPPKLKREGWVNVYRGGINTVANTSHAHATREDADRLGLSHRIDCVRIEWEEPA